MLEVLYDFYGQNKTPTTCADVDEYLLKFGIGGNITLKYVTAVTHLAMITPIGVHILWADRVTVKPFLNIFHFV